MTPLRAETAIPHRKRLRRKCKNERVLPSKFNDLFLEFNRYIFVNPEFTENFPQVAEVVLLDSRDTGYNTFMLKHTPKSKDIVFIDVGELAPVRSRLKHPKLIARPRIPA